MFSMDEAICGPMPSEGLGLITCERTQRSGRNIVISNETLLVIGNLRRNICIQFWTHGDKDPEGIDGTRELREFIIENDESELEELLPPIDSDEDRPLPPQNKHYGRDPTAPHRGGGRSKSPQIDTTQTDVSPSPRDDQDSSSTPRQRGRTPTREQHDDSGQTGRWRGG